MEVKRCRHCGKVLDRVEIFVHPQAIQQLDWLVKNRSVIADEQTPGEVLTRLIQLEFDKRMRIEERKQAKKKPK